eukprot:m.37308 g.37308  ORF g.37308 m.37308 type:complete len:206 (+) comp32355_c1_seq1:583-1200(+)
MGLCCCCRQKKEPSNESKGAQPPKGTFDSTLAVTPTENAATLLDSSSQPNSPTHINDFPRSNTGANKEVTGISLNENERHERPVNADLPPDKNTNETEDNGDQSMGNNCPISDNEELEYAESLQALAGKRKSEERGGGDDAPSTSGCLKDSTSRSHDHVDRVEENLSEAGTGDTADKSFHLTSAKSRKIRIMQAKLGLISSSDVY